MVFPGMTPGPGFAGLVPGFEPSDVVGLTVWLRATHGITKDGSDLVSNWADQSGNGNDFAQATGAEQPLWVDNVLNNNPVIRFDGIDNIFDGPNLSSLTAAEVFIVIKIDADPTVATKDGIWEFGTDAVAANNHYAFNGDNIIYDGFGTDTRKTVGDPTPSLASWRYYNVVTTSSEWTAFLDGSQLFTTATNTVGFMTATSLGGRPATTFLDGDVAEFILFDAKLSAGNKASVEQYIKNRHGL